MFETHYSLLFENKFKFVRYALNCVLLEIFQIQKCEYITIRIRYNKSGESRFSSF